MTPAAHGRPGGWRSWRAGVVFAWLGFTLAGWWAADAWQDRPGQPLRSLGFGYGALVEALQTEGRYRVCDVHYPGLCFSAHRLPLIPVFLLGLGELVGDDLSRVGLLKAAVFNVPLFAGGWLVLRRVRPERRGRAALLLLAVPLVLPFWTLTVFELSVEEAYLIPVLALLFAVLWFEPSDTLSHWGPTLLVGLLAALLIWLKHSMPYWAAAVPVLLWLRTGRRSRAAAAAALVLASMTGLAGFNAAVAGRFTVGSSWAGWNLYKGNHPLTAELYPRYTLDALDDRGLVQADRPLRDEWDYNRYFRDRALAFIRAEPATFLANVGRKAWVFLFEVRRTGSAADRAPDDSPLRLLQTAGMLGFRVALWSAIFLAVRGALNRSWPWREWGVPASFLAFLGLYGAFHLIGFAYERHVLPLVFPTVAFLVWWQVVRPEVLRSVAAPTGRARGAIAT